MALPVRRRSTGSRNLKNRGHRGGGSKRAVSVRRSGGTAAGSPELLRLSLIGVGRGNDLEVVGPGELLEMEGEKNKVRIRRPGDASEVPLPAHFELSGADRLRIVVDDAKATHAGGDCRAEPRPVAAPRCAVPKSIAPPC